MKVSTNLSTKGQQGHSTILTIIESLLHFVQNDVDIDVVCVQTLEVLVKRCSQYLLFKGYLGIVLFSHEACGAIILVYKGLVCFHLHISLFASSCHTEIFCVYCGLCAIFSNLKNLRRFLLLKMLKC